MRKVTVLKDNHTKMRAPIGASHQHKETNMNFEIAPKSTEIQANWDDAKFYCFSLSIDGKTGWRLPTIEELEKIFLLEHDLKPDWYWSATSVMSADHDTVRTFNFGYGERGFCNKDFGEDFVRAVRDRYKDNSNKPLTFTNNLVY